MSGHHHFFGYLAECLLIAACSEFCAPIEADAAFLDNGSTAREAALGGSFVAFADDASALSANPAGLGSIEQPEVIADYSPLYTGLTDGSQISQSYAGGATPLPIGGTLAGGWKQLHFDNIYSERTLSVGYGRWFMPRLALGASLKQLHVAYSPDNEIVDDSGNIQPGTPDLFAQNGTSRSAYSADLGALYKLNSWNTLGLAVQDVNQPNIALSNSDNDPVARTIRFGLASVVRPQTTLAMSMDTQQTLASQRDWTWTGGGEMWSREGGTSQYGVRGSLAAGSREDRQLATGASYRLGAFQMDYAFIFNLGGITLGDTYGSHRFTVAYRFGENHTRPTRVNIVFAGTQDPAPETDDLFRDEASQTAELILKIDPIVSPEEVTSHGL